MEEIYERGQRKRGLIHTRLLKTSVDESRKITEQLSVSTEGFEDEGFLSDNQVRGQFGEQVAEDLLKMAGFVKGVDYEFNKQQEGTKTRPDFSVFLPDGTRIMLILNFHMPIYKKCPKLMIRG